jgi:hypothetical protein
MSNFLAGLSAAKSFLDRTQHCTEAQPEAAEFAPGASKFESNFDVMQAGCAARNMGERRQETVRP